MYYVDGSDINNSINNKTITTIITKIAITNFFLKKDYTCGVAIATHNI